MSISATEESLARYQAARDLMSGEKYSQAVQLFNQSLNVRVHFKTLELIGECYLKMGKSKQAIVPLAAASMLNDGVRSSALLARALFEECDYHGAMRAAKIAMSRSPDNKLAKTILQDSQARILTEVSTLENGE